MPFKNMKNRCTAKSKTTGERCKNPAVTGYTVCYHHGANPKNKGGRKKGCDNSKPRGGGAPSGNANATKHGLYSSRLPPEEQERYESLRDSYLELFDNATSVDRDCVHRLALFQTKLDAAVEKGAPGDALESLQRMIHRELKALKATRESKDGGQATGTSPAEVMAALIARVRERQALPARVIDAESVEVPDPDEQEG